MKRLYLNYILAFLLIVVVVLTLTLRRDYLLRNYEMLPGMVTPVPFESQSKVGILFERKVTLLPVSETLPRGITPFRYKKTSEDGVRAGKELERPLSDLASTKLGRGANVYETFCEPCHGKGGMGDGKIVLHGFPPPPSLLNGKAVQMKDGQMFHILTYGQGNMPSLASQVSQEDRWQAISFIRSLQTKTSTGSGK